MQRDSVAERLEHLIRHDWTVEVEAMIRDGKAKGYAQLDLGLNVSDPAV
jgi:hypothetical protein